MLRPVTEKTTLRTRTVVLLILVLLGTAKAWAGTAASTAILPPVAEWNGKSLSRLVPTSNEWVTPFEAGGGVSTPRYDETVAYLKRLVAAAPELSMVSLGRSPEGREIWLVIASAEKARTPEALAASGKPTFFAQAGIHAGEIDGKDAGLMLLRDLTVGGTQRHLLQKANFLFVPIFNVDGHERFGRFGRVNQRGPEELGWRTTARNLNLNRDYAKLDAPEMRALVAALSRWQPDLYYDLHVTDGADYQYDITFDHDGRVGHSPAILAWMDRELKPAAHRDLKARGHVPGPLVFFASGDDAQSGLVRWKGGARFSTGYGDVRHLPTVLVENHSLKPYRQRVLGTYVLLVSALETLGRDGGALKQAIAADRASRRAEVPLSWAPPGKPSGTVEFLAIEARTEPAKVSGGEKTVWTGKPLTLTVPLFEMVEPAVLATRPKAYWVPPTYPEVLERLAAHGISFERISQPTTVEVEMFRLEEAQLAPEPFEGRVPLEAKTRVERRREVFPPGTARVPTDQPLGDLAMVLLEPESPDSFLKWGFFHEILQRTEYMEGYVLEPMAEAMLAEDAALAREFAAALAADPKLAADGQARLRWFYRRTPYWDDRYLLYPVGREPGR